jgi:hypothetical protein
MSERSIRHERATSGDVGRIRHLVERRNTIFWDERQSLRVRHAWGALEVEIRPQFD